MLMSAWSTVALSLGSAGVGATAALTATALQLRDNRRQRERAEEAAWRDRAANVLGPIFGVLDDMEPRAIVEHGGRSKLTVENIGRRWWRARDDLLAFGAANPSRAISAAAHDLADAVAHSWVSITMLNRDLDAARDSAQTVDGDVVQRAYADHDRARQLATELERLTRGSTARGE